MARASVGDVVYERILLAIQEGRLLPGSRLNDLELAAELGVSRAPVRDALQRLRVIGVVETVAGHYTRVVSVPPPQTVRALAVWITLYRMVLDETVPEAGDETVATMGAAHRRFKEHMDPFDAQGLAAANAEFYATLAHLANPELARALNSVVHVVRLGALNLPERLDIWALAGAQSAMVKAVQEHDVDAAQSALDLIGKLTIPGL